MSGSKKTETTEAKKDPWAPAQPLLTDILSSAQSLGSDPSRFTPTFSGTTRDAAAGLEALGRTPTAQQGLLPGLTQDATRGYSGAIDTLTNTASGGMLGPNPYLDDVLATAGRRAADLVNAQFAGAGRYGSGAHTGVLADRLGAIETNARMQNYDAERARQLNAAGLLTGEAQRGAQYANQSDAANVAQNQLLGQAGQMYDTFDNAVRTAPLAATQWQAGLATPIAGLGGTSQSTTTSSTPANIPGMIAGGLMGVAGLASGNPMLALGGLSSGLGSASGASGSFNPAAYSSGGMFGSSPTYSQPASAATGGWSTTATPAGSGWFQNPFSGWFR